MRKKEDESFFQTLCTDILDISRVETKNVIRLGKKNEDATKPRPLKISMKHKEDKEKIMSKLTKLKSADTMQIQKHKCSKRLHT